MIVATGLNYKLEIEVLNAEFRILNFDTAIMSWNLISFLFINRRVWGCLMDPIMTTRFPFTSLTHDRVVTTFVAPEAGLLLVRVGDCDIPLTTQGGGKVSVGQSANFLEIG
jgi:hypothetical protein